MKIVPIRVYLGVYLALLALLGLTAGLALVLPLGPIALLVALAIAGAKAALVVLYFMHVRYESRLTWIFAGAGLVWLAILMGLTLSDYLSRGWLSMPPLNPLTG